MPGKFITLEGTEGVGKSTNLEFISNYLTHKNIQFIRTREPGGTPFAEELRSVLLENRDEKVDPTAELLTVFAARAQHLNTVIKPALARGHWVLCDRFTDATFAYQGAGRGLDVDVINKLEVLVQSGLQPDLTLLLDIDVDVGLARATARAELDRFEQEEIAFFQRVRASYLSRAEQSPERFAIVDAGQALADVQTEIKSALDRFIDDV